MWPFPAPLGVATPASTVTEASKAIQHSIRQLLWDDGNMVRPMNSMSMGTQASFLGFKINDLVRSNGVWNTTTVEKIVRTSEYVAFGRSIMGRKGKPLSRVSVPMETKHCPLQDGHGPTYSNFYQVAGLFTQRMLPSLRLSVDLCHWKTGHFTVNSARLTLVSGKTTLLSQCMASAPLPRPVSAWIRGKHGVPRPTGWWCPWDEPSHPPVKIPLALDWAFALETSLYTLSAPSVRSPYVPLPQTFLSPILLYSHFKVQILYQLRFSQTGWNSNRQKVKCKGGKKGNCRDLTLSNCESWLHTPCEAMFTYLSLTPEGEAPEKWRWTQNRGSKNNLESMKVSRADWLQLASIAHPSKPPTEMTGCPYRRSQKLWSQSRELIWPQVRKAGGGHPSSENGRSMVQPWPLPARGCRKWAASWMGVQLQPRMLCTNFLGTPRRRLHFHLPPPVENVSQDPHWLEQFKAGKSGKHSSSLPKVTHYTFTITPSIFCFVFL